MIPGSVPREQDDFVPTAAQVAASGAVDDGLGRERLLLLLEELHSQYVAPSEGGVRPFPGDPRGAREYTLRELQVGAMLPSASGFR